LDLLHLVGGQPGLCGMVADVLRARSRVDAVGSEAVCGAHNVRVLPLDLREALCTHAARDLRSRLDVGLGNVAKHTMYQEARHLSSPCIRVRIPALAKYAKVTAW
jgi:hypothetical protein